MFGKNVGYPASAQRANRVGTVVGVIKISKNGEIVEVGTLNKADRELKSAFEKVAMLTKGKWAASNDTAQYFYAVLPIEFRIEGAGYTLNDSQKPDYFQKTIVLTGFSIPRAAVGSHEVLANDLVAQANQLVQQQKFNEGIKVLEQLVNFQPLNTAYYEPLIALNEKLGNASEAEYYRQVRNLFIPRDSQEEK